jgi:hypothetical protein
VDPGSEFLVGGGSYLGVDIAANTVTLDFFITGGLGATIINLTSLDWFGDPGVIITGATFDSISGVTGLTAGDLAFGDHSVSINLVGTGFTAGDSAVISLTTSNVSSVPEPSTSALFGLGLGFGLFFLRKRARSGLNQA